ncbi:type II toxin-antitoxin system PemK/MazF family toxin [Glaciimonas immobilis]|uniref:mRNA interferase n=2 Tax=Glaciimonas immobilis TaxID=728004 RepID=A0A840RMY1_9BURK|nr:type II toxin-antitoxin system PemK/MazF family toxin [Glaciimonas immobilis]KAF3999026.1 type II toxin-antitoxin system PemK/MazF family toxin [Glaciimonas immobilis]MBB5198452.1 mRNA interferase MazF [Glaciimonas immobilis]
MKCDEVWWVEFALAVGIEIRKTRPAVIVSNDAANRHMSRVQVVPLSSNVERIYPSETVITLACQKSKVMADQIMTADKVRLKDLLGKLSQADMRAVETSLKFNLVWIQPKRSGSPLFKTKVRIWG